jgi:two-component system, NtrC family, sensor kinase
MATGRTTLWADVVGNLAVLTVLTIVLNAVLLWRLDSGREGISRAQLAEELAQSIALRMQVVALIHGAPGPAAAAPFAEALNAALLPAETMVLTVVTTDGFEPVAQRGEWPRGLDDAPARAQWLVTAADLREAVGTHRSVRGEWRSGSGFLGGRSWATASAPILDSSRAVVGAVRVGVSSGDPFLGALNKTAFPILLGFTLVSAVGMGLFGFALFRRRILAPIEALAAGTESLAAGAFETRLARGPSNELGEVAEAFNSMAESLERLQAEGQHRLDELQAINADLRKARADLVFAEKMATVGRLAAGVAHELGNPLASVIGFAELLEHDTDGSLAPDLLPRIRSELDRIHRIVGELLAYSRRGEVRAEELEPVDVATMLRTVSELVGVQPRFGGIRITLELPEDLPAVLAVPDKLQQILLNLFVNAAESMDGEGQIDIGGVSDPECVGMSVRDFGRGIVPGDEASVFEPFFTTKDVGEGTGLGLSVSLQLAEAMGGTIELQPVDPGACFLVKLRRGPEQSDIDTVRLRGVRRSVVPARVGPKDETRGSG